MKKGSHRHQMMRHQQKMFQKDLREQQAGISSWDKLHQKRQKQQRKIFNNAAKSIPIWRIFPTELKDEVIRSFQDTKEYLKETARPTNSGLFFMSTGNIFSEIHHKMTFPDFITFLFEYDINKIEDREYGKVRIVKQVQEYKAQYRDMKIDMLLR